MADVTKLLAGLRGEEPPAVPYDPRAGKPAVEPGPEAGAGPEAEAVPETEPGPEAKAGPEAEAGPEAARKASQG